MSRKYQQRGYQEESRKPEKQRSQQRPSREGPRSPRMPAFHGVLRCAMCGARMPPSMTEIGFSSRCPKCGADLHSCKNCVYFDPGSRFECTQPIPDRIARKDAGNECRFFEARTAVEKMTTSGTEKPADARQAFENLFKK